jgi:hypothetical protein
LPKDTRLRGSSIWNELGWWNELIGNFECTLTDLSLENNVLKYFFLQNLCKLRTSATKVILQYKVLFIEN